ncbi:uncharacterized protein LOC133782181 isoform X1 [Humulus lupulus]|uniref:uncharacterized protein LOC133782181 isoform X1 n=1 Tax=Humulus lupulus TaxID=3486 RepID=UPI002B401412|nr:uncharacterized protein LOC133782181 isoform X1 [Humulus lupulus]XP_062077380.1 uncharacterized protein LOC133782181 isoform X1 [Humulus lupulus]
MRPQSTQSLLSMEEFCFFMLSQIVFPYLGYLSLDSWLLHKILLLEDSTLNLILDILCKVYRGEESLCSQFWDRESFVDGPIRCLLCSLEGEFPFRTVELICLLSSLSEGTWPAECVRKMSLSPSIGGEKDT